MFHPILKEKYEFLTNYFETAIKHTERDLPHSIILYGSDTLAQYILALNTAKILNCKDEKVSDCDCLNCRWVKANAHPAVLTITKLDNKPADDVSKTNISIGQVRMIKELISTTSEYHRVFIFCDADNKKMSEAQKENCQFFKQTGFELPKKEDGGEWYPHPLNTRVFPDTTANALLKSIEEPPERVTFIFLTKNLDDLIPTVVSRSQSFHVPGFLSDTYSDKFIEELMANYPEHNTMKAMQYAGDFLQYLKEEDIRLSYALSVIQNYLQKLACNNLENRELFKKIKKDIFKISETQKALSLSVKEQNLIETLFIEMF